MSDCIPLDNHPYIFITSPPKFSEIPYYKFLHRKIQSIHNSLLTCPVMVLTLVRTQSLSLKKKPCLLNVQNNRTAIQGSPCCPPPPYPPWPPVGHNIEHTIYSVYSFLVGLHVKKLYILLCIFPYKASFFLNPSTTNLKVKVIHFLLNLTFKHA